jgi:hypothetical protein
MESEMSTTEFDNLDIPEFLRISKEDRAAAWVGRTLTVPGRSEPEPKQEQKHGETVCIRDATGKVFLELQLTEDERKKLVKRNRDITRRAIEKEREEFRSIPKSMRVWNQRTCRWEADPYLKAKAEREAKAGKSQAIVIAPKADAKPKAPSKKLPVCERVHRFVLAIRGSQVAAKVANLNDTELADNLELWRLTSPERAVAKAERVYA